MAFEDSHTHSVMVVMFESSQQAGDIHSGTLVIFEGSHQTEDTRV